MSAKLNRSVVGQNTLCFGFSATSRARRRKNIGVKTETGNPVKCSASSAHCGTCSLDTRLARRTILSVLSLWDLPAKASLVGPAGDRVWQALGGGPSDLSFPAEFLGTWDTTSTLISLDTPLGEDYVPDLRVVRRAQQMDLNSPKRYRCRFTSNHEGKVVLDRSFNTDELLKLYLGNGTDYSGRIKWDIDDPNDMRVSLPGGTSIETRVTRRSQHTDLEASRTETSEFFRQVYDTGASREDKVKASQCFTKYKWRSRAEAERTGGPVIVATQVVSDYLTPFDGEERMISAMNKPVAVYTYRMSFAPA
uniref:DUF6816 domain-containing protein n=2 Tax=Tetraselmis sp. GSL018 TaxID=582737 RepID=A0A061QUK1_9CHLO